MKINQFLLFVFITFTFTFFFKTRAQSTSPVIHTENLRSDIPFSLRWYWPNHLFVPRWNPYLPPVLNNINELAPIANSFYSNKFLWTYKKNNENINDIDQTKSAQYAIPIYIEKEQAILFFNNDSSKVEAMIARNLCDNPLRAFWEIQWDISRPDYSSDDFINYQIKQIKDLVDDGVISFQQDNPGANVDAIDFGGSFSIASINGFDNWLKEKLSSVELISLGLNPNIFFNYKEYLKINLKDKNGNSIDFTSLSEEDCNCIFSDIKEDFDGLPIAKLKYYFREFQKDATKNYYQFLHDSIDVYIASKNFGEGKTEGIYSANNYNSTNKWLTPYFNFWVSELYPKENDEGIVNDIIDISRFGRSTFYEIDYDIGDVINTITVAREDKETNNNSIALSYASGMNMIVPWDIYINSENNRFYGNPSDYSDLLSFIKSNKSLFNNYNTLEEHTYSFLNYYNKVYSIQSYDSSRVNVKLLRNNIPKVIPSGSKVKIGNSEFVTSGDTGVGNIYIDKIEITNADYDNKPVYYIDLKDEDNSYTRYFDDSYKSKRSVNDPDVDITTDFITSIEEINNNTSYRVNWSSASDYKNIPKGSKVMIGGIEYETIGETTVGFLYISKNAGDYLTGNYNDINDASIWYIVDPSGNIIYPTENKPFAINFRSKNIDYRTFGVVQSITQTNISPNSPNKKTSIGWSEMQSGMTIPKGSKVLINNKEYLTHSLTTNGTLHLASEKYIPKETIKIGDDIWYIKNPQGNIIYPQRKVGNAVMHIINLTNNQPKKVAIKVKHSQFFKFEYLYSPNSSAVNKDFKSRAQNNIYTIDNLEKWAVFSQDQISNKSNSNKSRVIINENILIYPNPNRGIFTIIFSENLKNSIINVHNTIGTKIYSSYNEKEQVSIDLSNYPSGIYIIKIQNSEKTYTKKIIIN